MATRVVSKTINLDAPIEEVSKYITRVNSQGIQIHPESWLSSSNYVQIDSDNGFTVWNQQKQIAQYGEDTIIGDKTGFHIEVTSNYEVYFLSNDTSVNNSKTYYTKDNNNLYQKITNPSGNPQENGYYEKRLEPRLSFYRDGNNEVAYISGDKLYITQSVVLERMDVGKEIKDEGLGQWSWKVHNVNNKNNLYLKWLG